MSVLRHRVASEPAMPDPERNTLMHIPPRRLVLISALAIMVLVVAWSVLERRETGARTLLANLRRITEWI